MNASLVSRVLSLLNIAPAMKAVLVSLGLESDLRSKAFCWSLAWF